MQVIVCLGIILVFVVILIIKYIHDQGVNTEIITDDLLTPDAVLDRITKRLADFMKEDTFQGRDETEWQAIYNRRLRMEEAMTECIYGKDQAKIIVKDLIYHILEDLFPDLESLYAVYPLNSAAISPHWQFEILMEVLYRKHKKQSLAYLITKYGWDKVRYNIEVPDGASHGDVPSYNISEADLQNAYDAEITDPLTYDQALRVVATLNYERYKGMGIVDTLRTMDIDGFNFGTSGSVMNISKSEAAMAWPASRSVWIYFQGKYIHAQFLDFGSEAEARRVVQLIARYNNPGPLTEKRGYLVNTMYDKSRVLAMRPPVAEYWAVFVRKFVLSSLNLHFLIDPKKKENGKIVKDADGNEVSLYKRTDLAENLIKLLMRGQVTTAFTGRQGSGKTTMMVAAISQVDARFNIRVLEMAPEMYLREIYPQRNILSASETPTVTASEIQDAFKKSDSALSIVGEVATDIIAARMIQMGQVASIFTIFSHHANRTVDLVHALTNSVVSASGGTATPATVEPQVIDVIKVDAHLDYDVEGHRYIERITEIIRLDSIPYPEREKGESLEEYKIRLDKEYYTRRTDRLTFRTQDVLVFDTGTFTYDVARDENGKPVWFSPELNKHIFSRLPVDERQEWSDWVVSNWSDRRASA